MRVLYFFMILLCAAAAAAENEITVLPATHHFDCSKCHSAKAAKSGEPEKKDWSPVCKSCHDGHHAVRMRGEGNNHWGMTEDTDAPLGSCESCHSVHSLNEKLLRSRTEPVTKQAARLKYCRRCHQQH